MGCTIVHIPHFRRNKLSHTIYWKSRSSILGTSVCNLEKNKNKKKTKTKKTKKKKTGYLQMHFSTVWFGSAPIAKYIFGGLQTNMS